jgi:hypothetical protein
LDFLKEREILTRLCVVLIVYTKAYWRSVMLRRVEVWVASEVWNWLLSIWCFVVTLEAERVEVLGVAAKEHGLGVR